MEEQRTLTLDFVKSLMEPSYTLVWTDYNDNLDNHMDIIRKCLDRRNCDCLWEKAGEWYGDAEYEAVHGIMEKLKEEFPKSIHDIRYAYAYCIHGCMGIVKTWLSDPQPGSPEHVADLTAQFITDTAHAYLHKMEQL